MNNLSRTTDLPVLLPRRIVAPACEWGATDAVRFLGSIKWLAILAVIALFSLATVHAATSPSRSSVLEAVVKWMPLISSGFLFNLLVSAASMALGTACGMLLGLGQISLHKIVRKVSWGVTQFFRNAPWLVLLFFAMFLLPFELRFGAIVIPLPAWLKAIIGLSLPVMANVSEIVRGGIRSIPTGQWESAESLAFSRMQILWQIIIPQSIKRMIPPWMNLYAILTMATTLISIVGIQDAMTLTRGALVAEARTDLYLPLYFMLLLMFFAYCYPIARLTLLFERRFAVAA
jgi:polar amino acid transport system permease protein